MTPDSPGLDLDAIERFLGDGRAWQSPYEAMNATIAHLHSLVALARRQAEEIERLKAELAESRPPGPTGPDPTLGDIAIYDLTEDVRYYRKHGHLPPR